VTGVPEVFEYGTTVSTDVKAQEPLGTRAIQLMQSDTYPNRFLDIHGRPTRLEVPERNNKPNLAQVLHVLAGPTYSEKIGKEGGRLDRLLNEGSSDHTIIEEFSLAALSRFPTEQENAELEKLIRQGPSRRQAFEDLVWGLITTREFIHNH
jgi:hypothetical protein